MALLFSGNEGPSRVHDLFAHNEDLMSSLQEASNQVMNLKHRLQEREVMKSDIWIKNLNVSICKNQAKWEKL